MEISAKQLSSTAFRAQNLKEGTRTVLFLRAGLAMVYYRGKQGTWTARRFLIGTKYEYQKIGLADDQQAANNLTIFSFAQAQKRAERWADEKEAERTGERVPGDYSVAELMHAYIDDRERTKRRKLDRTRQSVAKHVINSDLGKMQVQNVRHHHLQEWLNALGTPKRKRKGSDGGRGCPTRSEHGQSGLDQPTRCPGLRVQQGPVKQ
jgi:hypothetical protein